MRVEVAAKTDVGLKRTHNEDNYFLLDEDSLFIVADGMGGHSSGEVASKMATEAIAEFFQRTRDAEATWPYKMDRNLSYVENRLVCGIKLANHRIFSAATAELKFKGMGTTIVTLYFHDSKVIIGHVGDSRSYRVRSGEIRQITRDHSLLEDYKEAKPDMTEEEQRNFPHKNVITRALGMRDTVQVDVKGEELQDGDTFLLCSDGLSGMVPDPMMLEIVKNAPNLQAATEELIDAANRHGGIDNITAVLARWHKE
jgi:protein phosphatase